MCTTCGCDKATKPTLTNVQNGKVVSLDHDHSHDHEHPHDHEHGHSHGSIVLLEKDILAKNNLIAERNRGWFEGRNILAINLVSSPGSGKTTLLERTLNDMKNEIPMSVIEGDQ